MASSFHVNYADLQRILENIKIAERESAGENLLDIITEVATGSPAITGTTFVNAANLPLGLRHVDGSYNQLIAGSPDGVLTGAADQSFARLVDPSYISGTGSPSLDLNPDPASLLEVKNTSYDPGTPNPQNDLGIHPNSVVDASVRTISNLIVDQTISNPAAIASALRLAGHEDPDRQALILHEQARLLLDPLAAEEDQADARTAFMNALAESGVTITSDGSIVVEHRSADIGLSPGNSSWMTIFGQFFDHGLDLLAKGGQGTVYIPLQPDDPLYVEGSSSNFMALTRAAGNPGTNLITPWIDQNQTYTSHPSHQVFLREYQRIDRDTGALLDPGSDEWQKGLTVATGRLLNGAQGGVATWADVKAQALTYLGIALDDRDVLKIPQVLTDPYGRFIAGQNGYAQLLAVDPQGQPITVEGTAEGVIPSELNVSRIAQAFLDDINRAAVPVIVDGQLLQDADMAVGLSDAVPDGRGGFTTYDNELLDAHYVTGDGRGNENIALTAIHSVFHGEHNRVLEANKLTILRSGDLEGINEWLRRPLADDVALPSSQASDADLTAFAAGLQWDGERLFQAAKFSTEMQYQHIVFEEFARRIQPNIAPFVFTNSADLDARIVAEFAHAVYRFGHSQLGDGVARLEADLASRDLGLIQSFLNPLEFANSGLDAEAATGAIARGITRVVDQEIDEFIVEALRNNLLGAPLDLASLNLARGRELGIPSLNQTRAQLYAMTGAVQLKPYTGWTVDPNQADSHGFFQHLKNPMSVVNLIAAYGTHHTITEATSVEAKRRAAMLIVFNTPFDGQEPPADSLDFLRGTGAYADQETGINDVDLWIGGLAEQVNEFGGQLGETFNAVFQYQMEQLQNGDRFYYLSRTQGMNLLTQLEATTFSDLVMRNSDLGDPHATHLSAHIMGVPDLILELDLNTAQANYSGDQELDALVGSENTAEQRGSLDPTASTLFDFLLGGAATSKVIRQYGSLDLDGNGFVDGNVLRFTGGEHVVLGGTEGNDAIYGDKGIDTLWGDGGDDYLNAGMESDQVFGGDGDDIIIDPFGDDFLRGENGDDVIVNGAGLDVDFGGAGQDAMFAVVDSTEMFAGEDNDFMRGGSAPDLMMGGEGDDWMEGGEGFDYMAGENSELFFDSPIVGHDIMNGQGNDTDYDGENGDDIMVQGVGIQRNNGMNGFDWAIHKGDPVAADTDLTPQIPGLVEIPDAALAVILRDRFDSVEGLSGWKYDDHLRGSVRSIGQNPWFQNQLTQAGVDRIRGLRAVLGGEDLVDPDAVAFGDLNIDGNSDSQIFLGGDGSDTIMGGVGDDLIDGDAWLNVRIEGTRKDGSYFTVDSLSDLFVDLVSGAIDPGEMHAVREILYDDRADGSNPDDVNLDVAVFQDLRENYDITFEVDGSVTVSHLIVSDGLQSDGMDRLRNIEVARFADQDLRLVNDPPVSSDLLATTELSTTGLFGFFGAANRVGLGAPALFDANNVTPDNPRGLVDPSSVSVSFFDAADSATALPLSAAGELVLAATPGRQLSMTASYLDAAGFANTFQTPVFNAIVGTASANTLTGTAGQDYIFGGAGADVLLGNGGDDYLSGGVGSDLLNGGDGVDVANFAGVATSLGNASNPPAQTVVDARFGLNGVNLTVSTLTGGLDTLVSIERLRFSDGIFDLVAGATSSADALIYSGDQRALLFGGGGDDNLRGGVDDDVFTYTAAGSTLQNAISGGGRDFVHGGANRELGDRLVIHGDNTTESFRVIAVAGDANVSRRTELSAAGFAAIAETTEIVILRGTGALAADAPLTTGNFAIIAEVAAIEELTINVSGAGGTGTQRVQVIGDFNPTSLRTNTITVSSDGAGVDVDVTSLESDHRVVLDAGTILGQRPQDLVQAIADESMTANSMTSDPMNPAEANDNAGGNVLAPLTLRDAQDLLDLVRGIAPNRLDPENADAVGVRDLAGAENNRANATFGAANEPFIRLTEARFGAVDPDSGTAEINPIFAGLDPRQISNSVAAQQPQTSPSRQANLFWMAFAQYFDHGLDFVVKGGNGTIPIGGFGSGGADNPADLTRATITGWDADGPQHLNQTSPFVDQNQAYGSTALVGQFLRESDGARGLGSHLLSGGDDPSAPGFQLLPTLRTLLDHHIAAKTIFTGTDRGDLTLTEYYPALISADTFDYDPSVIAELNRDFLGSGYSLLVDLNPFVSPLEHVVAGDGRPNENVALSSIHSIWARNHNYHVDQLTELYSAAGLAATPEEIFQAAKIINETEYQRIIFTEFAEILLGSAGIRGSGEHGFDDYQPATDARISHEFAAMAYRVGHTMIADDFTILDADGQPMRVPLVDLFLNPTNEAGAFAFDPDGPGPAAPQTGEAALSSLASRGYTPVPGYEQLGVARILGGMVLQPAEEVDPQVVDAVRNDLVRVRADLAAFNIARGWDLGLGTLNQVKAGLLASTNPYVQEALSYVGLENMTPYASWEDFQLRNGLADAELERLRAAYPDLHLESTAVEAFRQFNPDVQLSVQGDGSAVVSGIDRVDAWVGGLAEQKFEDSLLGTTFWTIIHEQLDRLQEGDRFYYLSRVDDLDFYEAWAKEQSFADIVERNTGLTGLPKDIFEVSDSEVLIGLPAVAPADAGATTPVDPDPADGLATDAATDVASDVVTKALHLGLSLHKLPDFTGDEPNELVLRPFGSPAERSAQFYLMLTAESLRDASIDTLDVTFDLGEDFVNVFELSGEQIFFSDDLALQRRVQIDGSKLRFEGAGLGALGAGQGVSEKAPIAVIALTPREDIDEQILAARLADRYGFTNSESWQQSLQFSVDANVHEIMFSDLMSLGDLGGEAALLTDELQVLARAAQVDLLTDDVFALGTERQVLKPGEGGFTNLIRSGDTLERTTQWQNGGEFTLQDLSITDLNQAGVATSKSWIAGGSDALAVGATADITTEISVYGPAGSVLDSAALGFQIDALGGYHWDTAAMPTFQQKNLVTYQADLNYDGRVSMKDLAFLNAGVSRGYSRDVDANYDGKLDINDLAVIDAEWGQSLHQGEGQFLGSDFMSMADLSRQGLQQWDSSAFIAQNAIEAEQQVSNPVAESGGTFVTVQGFEALLAQLEQQQTQQYDLT
ncbi:MAG: peroxidase family protein [Vulcanococcus sp.]